MRHFYLIKNPEKDGVDQVAGLKLGLDQTHHLAGFAKKLFCRRKHFCQGNKRNVHGCEINLLADIFRCHIAKISPLHTDSPLITAQLPCQLSMPYIDGIHPLSEACAESVLRRIIEEKSGAAYGPDMEKIILSVSEFIKRKNYSTMLQTIASLSKERKDFKYLLCGTGVLMDEMKALSFPIFSCLKILIIHSD